MLNHMFDSSPQLYKDKLRKLIYEEPDLGEPHIKVPDLTGMVILVLGATKASGFGNSYGRVAELEGHAGKVLLASSGMKGWLKLKERLEKRPVKLDASPVICDVTRPESIKSLERKVREIYGRLDAVVVAPAYLDTKYFRELTPWENIPEEDKEKCRQVSVYAIREIAYGFRDLLAASKGVVFGVSFPLKDLPGYHVIGPAKQELEDLATKQLAPALIRDGIRVNILSLMSFESVASLALPNRELFERLVASELNVKTTLGEMVRESVAAITRPETGQIYHFDGGLHEAFQNPANKAIKERIYSQLRAELGLKE